MVNSKAHILLVDDDPVDQMAIERAVTSGQINIAFSVTGSVADATRMLGEQRFDAVVLDYRLKDGTAFDLMPQIRDIPVLFVTGAGNESVAVQALQGGAADYLIKDDARQYLTLLATRLRNVIERHRAERALQRSEARFLDLFDNAPDMYFLVNEDGTVLSANKLGASQLGYTPEELVGGPVMQVIHPDDQHLVESHLKEAFQAPDVVHQMNFRKVRKDGSVIYVSERISAVQDPDGGQPAMRIICRDITAEKEAEERERDLRERLARSERLESLAILAGGVAHDLNNVLMPIVAYPDLLLEKLKPDSREHEDVLEIKRSAMNAAEIVRDLLTMARRGRYDAQPLNLNEVIEHYFASAGYRALVEQYPDVRVTRKQAGDLRLIGASEPHMRKVVMNLLINAFESIRDKGSLTIATYNQDLKRPIQGYEPIQEGEYVVLEVTDTGTGISPKDQERIFEPFYSKKKLGRSGTGLGLSVVYGVVKDHDGFIDIDSEENQGTTFRLYLPVTTLPVRKPSTKKVKIQGTESILVVDDLPDQREIAARLLSRLGYQVTTAINGRDAVHQCLKADGGKDAPPFDLVVMDMVMEEDYDGLDAFLEIRKIHPKQRCVIVSGYAETDRVKKALQKGAGAFIRKPYTMETLGLGVRNELDRKL